MTGIYHISEIIIVVYKFSFKTHLRPQNHNTIYIKNHQLSFLNIGVLFLFQELSCNILLSDI